MNTNPILTIRDLGLDISVWFDRYDNWQPERSRYGYSIADKSALPDELPLATGTDLTCVGEPDLCEALRTLLTFLSAAIESYPDGENADLFPASLLDVLQGCSDEVSYTATWLGQES